MPVVYKHALAEQDLVSIWLYTWQEWNEAQADWYLDDLERIMLLLAEQPYLARERKDLTPAVRIHPHAQHLIVYQAVDDGITVIRVLHKYMDTDAQLG